MSETSKLSPVEEIKEQSHYLRGAIPEELVDENDHFGKESVQLLKHHGTYQQDDRDQRKAAKASGGGKSHMFMVRTKLPGGRLTSSQMLEELKLCDEIGNDTLRITSRQGLQLHGVLKQNLHQTIHRINAAKMTTLGACGDVNRNVMCCPAPIKSAVYAELRRMTDLIAEHLAPRSTAYHEIWLRDDATGEDTKVAQTDAEHVEPIYGRHYLPRKFKIGIALPHDNCIDVYTHDLGLLAIVEGDHVIGYNVIVGGGMGVTPSAKKTFPAIGQPMCFVSPDRALDVIVAVVKVQRDFGNREDRKVARLKYLIANWGLEEFRNKVAEYYGGHLEPLRDVDVYEFDDHMGWHEQGDGRWFYGLNVENGRILDGETFQLKSAIREICTTIQPGIHLTSHQSILFTDIEAVDKDRLMEILQRHHVVTSEDISIARRWSMACVAWPTCGLSITESERALPGLIDALEGELERLGLASERFTIRMTGCPNGCARPYNSDIGLVGKTAGK
ncbi:MAG: NADPH-dependent assimilatory sulfite reductase hemoprotein subunit, partial [Planctomycetales bacterium]|nr:NADPH-dependent assimilatory sulfite reductase hemoprotein subunit [Planctomycetales bacterium]